MEIPAEFENIKEYSQIVLGHVVQAVRRANALPSAGDEYDFYTSYQGFRSFCQHQGTHLQKLIGSLLRQQDLASGWSVHGQPSAEEAEERFEALVEANDELLERVGTLLDEVSGLRHAQPETNGANGSPGQSAPVVASWNKHKSPGNVSQAKGSYKLLHAKNIQRPQLRFKDAIDNSNTPFVSRLKVKPNAIVPLPPELLASDSTDGAAGSIGLFLSSIRQGRSLPESFHPYEQEVRVFVPEQWQLEERKEQLFGQLEDTPLTYVDTVEQLEDLCKELKLVKEIAIDLEAHSFRSFQGFTCLMQLSTRDKDYLVDTLELRSEMHLLNDVFTDPHIVKVLHGADSDVVWLQRDFNLYLVNMFDSGQASRVLELPRFSLAYLLQQYCGVTANKQYQLADWRIRPLPEELVKYAREDTHYLLYIYDRLCNELLQRGNEQKNLLHAVLERSRELCLQRYEKPLFHVDSHILLYKKNKHHFNAQQMEALRLVYAWRDRIAREEDESTGYVMPNHMLFQIAGTLPREMQGVLACCNPVPTIVRQQAHEIHLLITQARALPLTSAAIQLQTPSKEPSNQSASCLQTPSKEPSNQSASCPTTPQSIPTRPSTVDELHSVINGLTKNDHASKADDGVPIREFVEGFAISGPAIMWTEPRLSALAWSPPACKGEGKLSKAQLKALEIRNSLVSPFAQTEGQSTASSENPGSLLRDVDTPDAGQEKSTRNEITTPGSSSTTNQSPHPIWDPSPSSGVRGFAGSCLQTSTPEDHVTHTDEDVEEPATLRQMQSGKKKKRKWVEEESSKASEPQSSSSFTPFDYDQAHRQNAAERSRHRQTADGGKKRARVDLTSGSPDFPAPPRSRVHNRDGHHSMAYSGKNRSSHQSGGHWPRR